MTFEWDNEKSLSNQTKHGIDFDTARALWDDGSRVEIQNSYPLESRRQIFMVKKELAKSTEEFDRRFDDGEDIHDLIDISKAKIVRHGRKVRITIDIAEELVSEIDGIRAAIGVDRGALIKVWLYERVKQEKGLATISQ